MNDDLSVKKVTEMLVFSQLARPWTLMEMEGVADRIVNAVRKVDRQRLADDPAAIRIWWCVLDGKGNADGRQDWCLQDLDDEDHSACEWRLLVRAAEGVDDETVV